MKRPFINSRVAVSAIGYSLFSFLLYLYALPDWTHQRGRLFWTSTFLLCVCYLAGMQIVSGIVYLVGYWRGEDLRNYRAPFI